VAPQAERCIEQLDTQKVTYTLAPIEASSSACTVDNPVRVSKAEISWNPPGVLACGFAVRLDDFLRETAEPLARSDLGSGIRSMRQYGAYSCRRIARSDKLSEHATGLAIDVAGFELANGTFVSVEHDWRGSSAKSNFLHEFARAACKRFSVVLTPDYNRDHYNHIHIDIGPHHLCGERAEESSPIPPPAPDGRVAAAAAE
jgi:hypothetical protein